MSTYAVQFTMPYFTSIPEDVITNTWHFNYLIGTPTAGEWAGLVAALQFFYNDCYNQTTPMLSPWINAAGCSVKAYDLADPTPRAPVFQSAAALSAANQPPSTGYPLERSICLSFQGVQISGQPQARRRGRIYLGGNASLDPGSASSFPSVGATIRTDICANAVQLRTDANAQNFVWSVWSRMDSAAVPVDNGWVDNAADTQRRRGNAATARTTFS